MTYKINDRVRVIEKETMTNQHSKQGGQEDFVEITEKYNSKGFLVERYYMKNGEQVDLPIPKFMQENPVVAFWNPKIDYVKKTKRITPDEFEFGLGKDL